MQLPKRGEYTWKNCEIQRRSHPNRATHRCDHQTLDRTLGGHHGRRQSKEGQVDDARVRANSELKLGFLLSNVSDDAPRNNVGRGSSERTRDGNRNLKRGRLQSIFNPDGTDSQVWIKPPPEADVGPDYVWDAVLALLGLKGAPRAWDTHSANVLTSSDAATVACSTILNYVENTSRRKQEDTSMIFW